MRLRVADVQDQLCIVDVDEQSKGAAGSAYIGCRDALLALLWCCGPIGRGA